jgi:hypothetical protein
VPKLKDELSLTLDGKMIQGRIIGIDHYHLDNFEGKSHRWLSYTLVSKHKGVFSRYWITNWKKAGWVLWTGHKRGMALKNKMMVTDRSGITKIGFLGEKGVSTPVAAVAVYRLKKGVYYAMERFSGSQVMFFQGREIIKPKVVKTRARAPRVGQDF